MTIRPRRTVLYMPGSNARALEKAKTLAADGWSWNAPKVYSLKCVRRT